MVQMVEAYYKKPMDTEWAYEKKKLYLLQARPITAYIPLHPDMITKPGEKKYFYVDVLLAKQGISTIFSVAGLDFWDRTQAYFFADMMGKDVIGLEDGIAFNLAGKAYQNQSNFMKAMGKKVSIKQWRVSDAITADVLEQVDIMEYIPKKTPKKLKGLMLSMISRNIGTMKTSRKAYKSPKETMNNYQESEREFYSQFTKIERVYKGLSVNGLFDKLITWYTKVLKTTLAINYAAGFGESGVEKVLKKLDRMDDLAVLERSMPNNITIDMGLDFHKLSEYEEIRKTNDISSFVENLKHNKYSAEFIEKWNAIIKDLVLDVQKN